jgi:hypothetical protein
MITSPTTTLSEPVGAEPIPLGTLAYFRSRYRHRLHSLVLREFRKSGLTQADLARRLGKRTDVVCRLLAAPGNWQLDTVSDLLFALSAAEPGCTLDYPFDRNVGHQGNPQPPDASQEPVETRTSGKQLLKPYERAAAE